MDATTDDAELMTRYRKGDIAAFEVLYARHKSPLYRYVLHQCQPRSAADDVFQEVWSRVIAHREKYEARASFKTYLYRIAHHCVMDHYRARSRKRMDQMETLDDHSESLPVASHEQPEAQAAQTQLEDCFQQALSELPQEQRDVFVMFEESGLGLKEIAEVAGVSAETAKSRLRYALNKLRRALAQPFEAGGLTPAKVQARVES